MSFSDETVAPISNFLKILIHARLLQVRKCDVFYFASLDNAKHLHENGLNIVS